MKQLRKHLTYANVMSSIAVFLVLGGAAIAASQLPRHSVGVGQLKAGAVTAVKLHRNAVTTAKLRRNAVTRAKIRAGAVNGRKIANGSVTGADINAASTPFSRVIARLRGGTSLGLTEEFQAYPLNPSTYTQAAKEDDSYVGAVDVTFQPGCTAPRKAIAVLTVDSSGPPEEEIEEDIVDVGMARDTAGGTVSKRIELSPYPYFGSRFEPGTATSHTLSLIVNGECEAGSGITATAGAVDVIGTR